MTVPPAPPLPGHYTPAVSSRRWIITLAIAILAAGAGSAGTAWYLGDGDQARALKYARAACKDYSPDPRDSRTMSSEAVAANSASWHTSADDAARAARLDPAWNELALAMDTQDRYWRLTAQLNGSTNDRLAALGQETGQHPVDPECRKANVS